MNPRDDRPTRTAGSTATVPAAETREHHVGARDLTRWPSAAGRGLMHVARRLHTHLAADQVLLVTLLTGLLVVAVAATLAGAVYDAVAEADGVAGFDRPALDLAKSLRTPLGNTLVNAWTTLGGPVCMPVLATLVAVALALRWHERTPLVLVAATAAGSLLLTVAGKALVGRVRPPFADAVPPQELGASFPSGHSLNAAAVAGVVAYLLVRHQRTARARAVPVTLAVTFAFTMGLSRVYLGHHWLTDVLVAWALGAAWLAVVVTAHRILLTLRRPARGGARE